MTLHEAKIINKMKPIGYLALIVSHVLYGLPILYIGIRDNWSHPQFLNVWVIVVMLGSYWMLYQHRKANKIIRDNEIN